ncbi:MAG: TIGR03435 family protein [Acidobacteriaceae bacterium]
MTQATLFNGTGLQSYRKRLNCYAATAAEGITMLKGIARNRTVIWKLVAGLIFISVATMHGQSKISSTNPATDASAKLPTFEVANVRPAPPGANPKTGSWSIPSVGRFTANHLSLSLLIQLAYDIDSSQIANQPGWLDTNLYDIAAKPEDGIHLTREELRPRLQDLLQQRFHLVAHSETRSISGYALVVAKGGPHLTPTKADHFPGYRINVSSGHMRGDNWSMPQLAKYLTPAAGFPVVDQTGITGSYDIDFSYNPKPFTNSSLPPLDVALKQATGLLLKPQKVPVETLVIDSVDKVPTEN